MIAMRTCVYCGDEKEEKEFSDEHIWPDALGGDHLNNFWRTDDVCRGCNSASGVYVDGAFIKSFAGAAERSDSALEYVTVSRPEKVVLPLNYLGYLRDLPTNEGEVAEFWVGPCGANIVHFRPSDLEDNWAAFASGDPRLGRKPATAGRVYMALTSEDPFWIEVSLSTFKAHFKRAAHFVTNAELRPEDAPLKQPDLTDLIQAKDMAAFNSILTATMAGKSTNVRVKTGPDLGARFMAKLALAVGYKLFGTAYLATDYAKEMRRGFREANPEKRRSIRINGIGYWQSPGLAGAEEVLKWPGAWVLMLMTIDGAVQLNIVTPRGRTMHVTVTADAFLVAGMDGSYRNGIAWLTVPELGEAVGPIELPDYIAHQLGERAMSELDAIHAKRIDPGSLPSCR
jgi:hypothetical protein